MAALVNLRQAKEMKMSLGDYGSLSSEVKCVTDSELST